MMAERDRPEAKPGLPADSLPEFAPGTDVGNYRVLAPLSKGGIHRAYIAEHRRFDRRVVLVLPAFPGSSRERFDRWLEVMAKLDHPRVVPLYDCGEHQGLPYAVLRYVRGSHLGELVPESEGLELMTGLRLIRAVAGALGYCHEQGIAHRNAKLQHLVVDEKGVPFLTGFLLASALQGDPLDGRGGGVTPSITPPEVWDYWATAAKQWTPLETGFARADVWAAGVALHYALTGTSIFPTKGTAGLEEVRTRVCAPEPLELPALERFPPPVSALVAKCLEKDPRDRYEDGTVLEQALEAVIDNLEGKVHGLRTATPQPGRMLLLYMEPRVARGEGVYVEVRVEGCLGSGATADVYEVTRHVRSGDGSEDRRHALKILKQGLIANREALDRFRREAMLLSRVHSPYVVGVQGFGQLGPSFFILMDLLSARTLRDVLEESGALSVRRATGIIRQVAEGLAALHDAQLVHRDLKPENIMVGDGDECIIGDFGLARGLDTTQLTRTGAYVGTPAYSAPEQIRGFACEPASDIFSLGVIFYELVAGCRPFEADTFPLLAQKIVNESPEPIENHVAGLPERVVQAIERCLEPEPLQRFGSVHDLIDSLGRPGSEQA